MEGAFEKRPPDDAASSRRCFRCRYFSPAPMRCGTCDYFLKTGRPRSRICPAGDKCTVFEPRGGKAKFRLSDAPESAELRRITELFLTKNGV